MDIKIEWKQDYTALIVSYIYVFAVIGLGELFRRAAKRPLGFTRKVIHVGVGMWMVGTVVLFESWQFALIPPVTFVVINAISYWLDIFKAMEAEERGNLGTIYFPIAFGALIYLFWDQPLLLVVSVMPMTWGDAMAAVIGQRYGHYRFTVGGHTRSLEGSAAMMFWSWMTTFVALLAMPYLLGQEPLNWLLALIYSGMVSIACTTVEALTPWGIDNLTVPAAAALALSLVGV